MGFRSTWITEDMNVAWPAEWLASLPEWVGFSGRVLYSKTEGKLYDDAVFHLIREGLLAAGFERWPFNVVVLHECGGVVKVEIHEHEVLRATTYDWAEDDDPHWYCYRCSEIGRCGRG